MKKILVHPDLMNQIADEFGVTLQSVRNALRFIFNSERAKNIRKRAVELLEEEAKKLDEETNSN